VSRRDTASIRARCLLLNSPAGKRPGLDVEAGALTHGAIRNRWSDVIQNCGRVDPSAIVDDHFTGDRSVTRRTLDEDPSPQHARKKFGKIDEAPDGVARMRRTMARLAWRTARRVAAAAVAVLVSSQFTFAQPESRISGVVRDATGAGIPDVTVTATHLTTRASETVVTGGDGSYSLSVLPGTYSVSAEIQGFRRVAQQVSVSAAVARPLDFLLQTALTEEVTVTATKRAQTLLDVPLSVAAPAEEALRLRGVETIEGVAANVAGLTVQNLGPGQSLVAIRGVSAGQIVRDQPGVKEQVGGIRGTTRRCGTTRWG
jgi:hypothetical protein